MSALNAITNGQNSYLAILDEAWQAHLAPRGPDALTVVSLFAGCGGSSLGYSMAGYRELLAVEWDAHAVDCFKLNFPDVPIFHGDIAKLSSDEALRMTGLQPGELDVLDGSPPCQGFSTVGKRVLADPRNGLFREYVRLLEAFNPKAFVMENVSGMVKGKMKLVFAEIMRALKGCGYKVSARLMNAMYFHVPQSRARMIFVGLREDLEVIPNHPRAAAIPITAGLAIDGCHGIPLGQPTLAVRKVADRIRPGRSADEQLPQGTAFSVIRLNMEKPSPAITKSLAGTSGILQPTGTSYLSEHQLKRLASFPDMFAFTGTGVEKWARIGNSVPPLFMRAIAAHVAALFTPQFVES